MKKRVLALMLALVMALSLLPMMVAAEGEGVRTGDVLLVLEAMKMEIEIKAPSNGTVSSFAVKKGDQVQSGAVLAYLN